MGKGKAYKNVICLGHLLDAKGKKMSKSIGNVVDPFLAIDKYGVDTLRMWMYSVNQPGESKNFDEKTVQLIQQQVFTLLYNVLAFYELYRDINLEKDERPNSKNILDIWILTRFDELVKTNTENLDNYKLLEPARAIREFIGDLSTWYLRRSRERIKDGDVDAKKTLYFVLKNLTKLMAPFAPFTAEDIWLKLRSKSDSESVHLAEWPLFKEVEVDKSIISEMKIVREIVSLGLQRRQKNNIPVRQPLSKIFSKVNVNVDYIEIIKEELNVKEFIFNDSLDTTLDVYLDTNITPELKQEGDFRELLRGLQDMRKKMGLTPNEIVNLSLDTDKGCQELVSKFESELKKTVLVEKVEFKENDGEVVKIGELVFKVKISKI
jgi:isoleucyl-tRNA synthetase